MSATHHLVILIAMIGLTGCVRRDGRNSDCKWPSHPQAKTFQLNQPGYQQHLREDVEFAEELAIRYMDVHYGPRDPQAAGQAMNRCLGILLGEIGNDHGITAKEAFKFFGQRSMAVDIGINLPFILLYGLAGDILIRRLRRRYPPGEDWIALGVVIVFYTLAFGFGGLLLGGMWSNAVESLRVGSGHLSNRALRLPWNRHQGEILAFLVVMFVGIAAVRYRAGKVATR
jgi:hypothetical protein